MDLIAQYVKNLAAFMVFAAICTIIMPEGRLKGMLGFVMGIMLMMIILRPVNAMLGGDGDKILTNSLRLNSYAVWNTEEYGDGAELVLSEFEKNCEEMLKEKLKANSVDVSAENGADGVYISSVTVNISGGGDTAESISRSVASICGIDESIITVINADKGEYNEAD
jgi:stage III sporulation protein AF